MHLIRAFLQRHFHAAAVILALALAMKALVPAGYMIGSSETRTFTVEICDGQGGSTLSKVTLPGKADGMASEHGKAAKDCPFTALSMHVLAGEDMGLLALALAFILALGFAPAPPLRLKRIGFLSPPLRGPPALS